MTRRMWKKEGMKEVVIVEEMCLSYKVNDGEGDGYDETKMGCVVGCVWPRGVERASRWRTFINFAIYLFFFLDEWLEQGWWGNWG